jgi:hypothetical protein
MEVFACLELWDRGCFEIGVRLQEVRVRSAPIGGTLVVRSQTYSRLFRSFRKRKPPQAAIRAEHDDEYAALNTGRQAFVKKPFCRHPRTQSSLAGFTDNLEDGYANITPFVFCFHTPG